MAMHDGYFEYLVSLVGGTDGRDELLEFLNHIEFRYDFTIYLDGNRAENGKRMRASYQEETGRLCEFGNMVPCTVLEALVSLAVSISSIMDSPDEYDPGRWFFEMIDNLGLSGEFDEETTIEAVGRWMARDYDDYGRGSIFPMKRRVRDFKHMPIWDQACAYLNERY